jgi:hypothetical protein
MHHVRTQAPYAILVGVNSIIFGDLLSGYLYPMWVGLLVSVATTCVSAYFLSVPVHGDKEDMFDTIGFYKLLPASFFSAPSTTKKGMESDGSHSGDKDGGLAQAGGKRMVSGDESYVQMPTAAAQDAGATPGHFLG